MNIRIGAGILTLLPNELFDVEPEDPKMSSFYYRSMPKKKKKGGERTREHERCREYLHEVAELGFWHLFNEVILDEVLEVSYRGGSVESRWLDAGEAAGFVRAAEQVSTVLPLAARPDPLQADFYFPSFVTPTPRTFHLPNVDAPCYAEPLREGLRTLQDSLNHGPGADREFIRDALNAFKAAQANRLITHMWYE